MDKEFVDKIVEVFIKNSVDFKFDTYINEGKSYLRAIFIYNHQSPDNIKKLLDGRILKNFKIEKTYNWYLGEKQSALLLKLKEELELEIPELEKYPVNNYS